MGPTPGMLALLATIVSVSLILLATAPLVVGGTAPGGRAEAAPVEAGPHLAAATHQLPTPGPSSAAGVHSTASPTPSAGITLGWNGVDPTALSLNWSATSDLFFTQYSILQSPNGSAGSFTSVAVVTVQTTTTYVAQGLSPGLTYWWEVTETGAFGSQTTNPINVSQPTLGYLSYSTPTASSAWFNWTNNATYGGSISFVSYDLFEEIGGAPPTLAASFTNFATLTTTVTGLSPATSYVFFLNTSDCYSGCGGTGSTTASSQSNVVTLGTPLPLAVSITTSHPVVDVGQSDLFACSPSGGRAPFSFLWDFGDGTNGTGASSIAHSYSAVANHTARCTVSDATPTQVSAATFVAINIAPSLTEMANRTTSDIQQAISFSCSPSGGTAPFNTAWAFGDSAQSSGAFTTHAYSSPGTFVATCTAIDAVGVAAAGSVVISLSPSVDLATSTSSNAAAPGTQLTFSARVSNGSGVYGTLNWSFGDGGLGAGSPALHTFVASGTYGVTGTISDSNGGVASSTVTVHVSDILVNLSVQDLSVAVGQYANFSANASGGAGAPFNFTWTFSDGTSQFGPAVSHLANGTGSLTATVEVRDALGAKSAAHVLTIQVVGPPSPPPSYTLWYLIGATLCVIAAIVVVIIVLRRRALERTLAGQLHRIPPTDPSEVASGAKVCRSCGASNRPLRGACANCGRAL